MCIRDRLLADEQESMIDRYLERGELFALYDNDLKSICVVTEESPDTCELKSIATVSYTHLDRLETDTWCQCTTGYSKVLFETAFSCRADVELLKSIKMGDDVCLMKITLHNPVWR